MGLQRFSRSRGLAATPRRAIQMRKMRTDCDTSSA
jgi:hypothetical protein